MAEHRVNQEDLERVALCYQRLCAGVHTHASARLPADDNAAFDQHVNAVLASLSDRLVDADADAAAIEHVIAKLQLWAVTHAHALAHTSTLAGAHTNTGSEKLPLSAAQHEDIAAALASLLQAESELIAELSSVARAAKSRADARLKEMQAAQKQREAEMAQVLSAAEQVERELAIAATERDQFKAHAAQAEEQLHNLQQQVAQLQAEMSTLRAAAERTAVQQHPAPAGTAVQPGRSAPAARADVQMPNATSCELLAETRGPPPKSPAPRTAPPPTAVPQTVSSGQSAAGPPQGTAAAIVASLERGVSFVSVASGDGSSVSTSGDGSGAAPLPPTHEPANAPGSVRARSSSKPRRRIAPGEQPKYMKPTQSWRRSHTAVAEAASKPPSRGGTAPNDASRRSPVREAAAEASANAQVQSKVLSILFPGPAPAPASPLQAVADSRAAAPAPAPAAAAPPAYKLMSLKALKETIDAIYSSKARFDTKCAATRQPRETMEQHMYTYLNTRFGLRQLVVEQAGSIISSMTYYSPHDNDVAVFAAILRNEIDEDFRLVQAQLKETARELLRLHLKALHMSAGDAELAALLAQRMGSDLALFTDRAALPTAPVDRDDLRCGIVEAEWMDIIKRMYTAADVALLMPLLQHAVARLAVVATYGGATRISTLVPPTTASSTTAPLSPTRSRMPDPGLLVIDEHALREVMSEMSPTAIQALAARRNPHGLLPWDVFLKILLDFQLTGHKRFLAPLRTLFAHLDPGATGVISVPDFRRLATGLNPMKTEHELQALVAVADPSGHSRVTFSECVAALANELAARLQSETTERARASTFVTPAATLAATRLRANQYARAML